MFNEKLRELRLKNGLSQVELSKILNISQTSYSQCERGICEPNIEMLKKIARYFKVSLDILLETNIIPLSIDQLKIEIENLDRKQLMNKVFENRKINPSALWLFFERYNSDLKENEIDFFEDILVSKSVSNEDKNSLFEMLICFGVDKNLKYHNQNIGETFNINPIETSLFEQIELYNNTKKIIDDLASKEPSLLNFCYNILTLIYKYYFPSVPNYDYKDLAKSIFSYMYNTLRGEKINNDEITSLIIKILQ